MKFKAQKQQNQLIERITDYHLIVGIDIAQETHVARAVNYRGIALGEPLSFPNTDDGFKRLQQWIRDLHSTYQLHQTIVGMEPTGHYWHNVSRWLTHHHCEVVLVNPHLVKKNKENRDNTPSKSDVKDALVIADMVKNGYYAFVRSTSESFEVLRVLMANRDFIVKRQVSATNQIHRWIDIVFPELRQVYKHIPGVGALATLRLFPTPADLRDLQPQDIIRGWKTKMKRHSGLTRAEQLISLAKRSVGAPHAREAYKLHLKQLLEEYDLATLQLQTIEQEIQVLLERIPVAKQMLQMKGMSAISVAGILGESGDLSGYVHGNSLLRHAGLNLAEASSGKWRGQMVLSKRGRPRLRHFLFMATMGMVMNDPGFKALHWQNVHVKKIKKMKSIMKLCGKLARILVGMARRGEAYCPDKVQSMVATAA